MEKFEALVDEYERVAVPPCPTVVGDAESVQEGLALTVTETEASVAQLG
jgi:hypothetical protein